MAGVNNVKLSSSWGDADVVVHESFEKQTRIITLNIAQCLESSLHCLEKGWILEFHLGATLFGSEICLYTNHPTKYEEEFQRNIYYPLEWLKKGTQNVVIKNKDSSELYAQLLITKAGSFNYYFTEKTQINSGKLGSGYFTVNPVLRIGQKNDVLFLRSVQCQTVLAKCLGPFSEWEGRLRVSKECGYNMIHFTPIQELGGSNSSYCIKDQIKLNPRFSNNGISPTYADLGKLITKMQKEWGVLSISDIVLNHTANETPWLLEYPECSYNMVSAPYLKPAALLDGYLHVFSKEVSLGMHEAKGIPNEIYTEEHIQAIKLYLETELMPKLALAEYYTCDTEKLVNEFKKDAGNAVQISEESDENLKLINNLYQGRNQATVDMKLALKIFNKQRSYAVDEEDRISICAQLFKKRLCELNEEARNKINDHVYAAINNCIANIRYHRVQPGGPKIREVSEKNPLVPRYFTGKFIDYKAVEEEIFERGQLVMAHNGWVENFNSLKSFADSDSDIYIRRELNPWGDSVKLNYGKCREDCVFLWDHMRKYIEKTVNIFHGIRLDNCHSTPLPVAEYLLDCARNVRPDLYVVAELFANSRETENIFINRLGITTVVRESINAWNSHELGRLVYCYGGEPVGSFLNSATRPLVPNIAPALFYDVTHDNESLIEKRSIFDLLASSAMVSMTCCATGSSRGFDELVPHHIDVVNEDRVYMSWTDAEIPQRGQMNEKCGIVSVKKKLNLLHKKLSDEGYSQIYVDQMNDSIVAVTRHNPVTQDSVVLVAFTAFFYPPEDMNNNAHIKNLKLEGILTEVLFEAFLECVGGKRIFQRPENFTEDNDYINGLDNYKVKVRENIKVEDSSMVRSVSVQNCGFSQYEFVNFKPGSIFIAQLRLKPDIRPKMDVISKLSNLLLHQKCDTLIDIATRMNFADLNFALYRCSEEDKDEGYDAYVVPEYGSLVYCGLQGIHPDIPGGANRFLKVAREAYVDQFAFT